MLKAAAAAMTALLVVASPLAHAQTVSAAQADSSAADWKALTDVRIDVIKAALQLSPEQEKYWPGVEQAIRFRAQDRQERLARIRERAEKLRESGPAEFFTNRDPVAFLNRRATALAQRSAGLKKLAEAWEPLYKTLDPDQKERMRFVTVFVLAEAREAIGQRLMQRDEDFADE